MYFRVQNFVHNLTVWIYMDSWVGFLCVFYSSSAYPHPKVKMVEPRTDRPKYPRQNLSLICDGSHERQKTASDHWERARWFVQAFELNFGSRTSARLPSRHNLLIIPWRDGAELYCSVSSRSLHQIMQKMMHSQSFVSAVGQEGARTFVPAIKAHFDGYKSKPLPFYHPPCVVFTPLWGVFFQI